jgi:putative sigma-54 modulation protein
MTIEYTGRQTEVPQRLKALAERKLRKLARTLRGITHVHVTLSADKHRKIAEVSVHSPHLDLTATEQSADLGASLATVLDKLTRQAQRQLGKRRERKRRVAPGAQALRAAGTPGAEAPGRDVAPRVIRSRRVPVKPMTVDEAALEVGQSRDGLVIFRDALTERVSVLYRRRDGNLGLIEPEA